MKEIEILQQDLKDYKKWFKELVTVGFYLSDNNEILGTRREDYDFRDVFSTELIIMVSAVLEDEKEKKESCQFKPEKKEELKI